MKSITATPLASIVQNQFIASRTTTITAALSDGSSSTGVSRTASLGSPLVSTGGIQISVSPHNEIELSLSSPISSSPKFPSPMSFPAPSPSDTILRSTSESQPMSVGPMKISPPSSRPTTAPAPSLSAAAVLSLEVPKANDYYSKLDEVLEHDEDDNKIRRRPNIRNRQLKLANTAASSPHGSNNSTASPHKKSVGKTVKKKRTSKLKSSSSSSSSVPKSPVAVSTQVETSTSQEDTTATVTSNL